MKIRLFLLLSFFAFRLHAQNCAQGLSFFQNQQFEQANKTYAECVKESPQDSFLVYMKGLTLVRLERYEEAIPILENAVKLNYFPQSAAEFNIAKCYAHLEELEKAISFLKIANDNGFNQFQMLDSDDFKTLAFSKDHAVSFQNIQQQTKYNAYPCLAQEENQKFDFWIGKWEVYSGGQKIATSDITKAKGGCAVHENYKTFGLYSGQSINFYNPTNKKWEQYWVGSSGDRTAYLEADDYEANLQFLGAQTLPNGQKAISRMSFVYDEEVDTVTQSLESSTDDGKTWTAGFVGVYKRRAEE